MLANLELLLMEEILHHLGCKKKLSKTFQLVQDFFHQQYQKNASCLQVFPRFLLTWQPAGLESTAKNASSKAFWATPSLRARLDGGSTSSDLQMYIIKAQFMADIDLDTSAPLNFFGRSTLLCQGPTPFGYYRH